MIMISTLVLGLHKPSRLITILSYLSFWNIWQRDSSNPGPTTFFLIITSDTKIISSNSECHAKFFFYIISLSCVQCEGDEGDYGVRDQQRDPCQVSLMSEEQGERWPWWTNVRPLTASHCLASVLPASPSSPPGPGPRCGGQGHGVSRATNQVRPAGRGWVSRGEAGTSPGHGMELLSVLQNTMLRRMVPCAIIEYSEKKTVLIWFTFFSG